MDMLELIRSRRSVRTFDGTQLADDHKAMRAEFIGKVL